MRVDLGAARNVEERKFLLGVHRDDGGGAIAEKGDRARAREDVDRPLERGPVEMAPRPVEAGQRIFEDLVGDRAKPIPVGNHRVGRGPAERQALGEAQLELLKARVASRDAKADDGRLADPRQRRNLRQARFEDASRIAQHEIGDLGLRFAHRRPGRPRPLKGAVHRTQGSGIQCSLLWASEAADTLGSRLDQIHPMAAGAKNAVQAHANIGGAALAPVPCETMARLRSIYEARIKTSVHQRR